MSKFYVNQSGVYLGGFEGNTFKVPVDAIEVPFAPKDARALWVGNGWSEPALSVKEKEGKSGVTTEAMVEALWARFVDNDLTALDDLKIKKDNAKQ